MTPREQYIPGPASEAQVQKDGDKWTLILVRELRHAPEKVWLALTDPAHVREWAPFDVDGNLATVGAAVNFTWSGRGRTQVTTVTRAEAPEVLEYGDIRWELEAFGSGTRLTLWHSIDRRFISWGAAGVAHLFRRSGSPAQRNSHQLAASRAGDVMQFAGFGSG